MSFQTCMIYLFLWNTEDDVLMNVNNQTVLVTIDLHCIAKKTRLEMFHRRKRVIQG